MDVELIEVIRSCKKVFEHQNQHLSPTELDEGWKQYLNFHTTQATGPFEATRAGNVVPSKRIASNMNFGMEPPTKRTGHVGISLIWLSFLV